MEKTYKSSKLLKKYKTGRIISFVIILFGVPKLLSLDFSGVFRFEEIGSLLDGILPLFFGIYLFFIMNRNIKKVVSNYITFKEDHLSFSSRGIYYSSEKLSGIKSIEIKLKTITLTDEQLNTYKIYMDDYSEFKDKKSIKSDFSNVQTKLQSMHNNK